MYEPIDAAVVRAAAHTRHNSVGAVPWPELVATDDAGVAEWTRWLRQVWSRDAFALGVDAASPVLARRVREICRGERTRVRDVRRAVLSVLRYALRASPPRDSVRAIRRRGSRTDRPYTGRAVRRAASCRCAGRR